MTKKATTKITKDTILAEILKRPKADEILAKYQLPCLHCPMAAGEIGTLKLGQVAEMYSIDIESLLKELNASLRSA